MSRVKRQHFVPQFYLRRFAKAGTQDQVHVFDKSTGKEFISSIQSAASRRYFYDFAPLDEAAGQDQVIEKLLGCFEGAAASAIAGILDSLSAGTFRGVTEQQRLDLALYLPIQILRTEESREKQVQWVAALQKTAFEHWLVNKDPELAEKIGGEFDLVADEQTRKAIHLRTLLDEEHRIDLANILIRRCWLILDAGERATFLTSDHPVVYRGHAKHPWRSMQGLGCPLVELTLPLSPRYSLYVFDQGRVSSLVAQDLFEEHLLPVPPANVTYCNSLQVIDSTRHVYSSTGEFQMARAMVSEDPGMGDPRRPRVEVRRGDEIVNRASRVEEPGRQRWGRRKVGRNALCPCGSCKKYKKCCLGTR